LLSVVIFYKEDMTSQTSLNRFYFYFTSLGREAGLVFE